MENTETGIEKRYTLKELIELSQISRASIYRHIEQGKLSRAVGKRAMYKNGYLVLILGWRKVSTQK